MLTQLQISHLKLLLNLSPSRKLYIIIGIIVVLLLISTGAGAYYLGAKERKTPAPQNKRLASVSPTSQPPDPTLEPMPTSATANWKTYQGQIFSVKYPIFWHEKEVSPGTPRIGYAEFYLQEHPYVIPETSIFLSKNAYIENTLGNGITNDDLVYVQVFNSKKAGRIEEFAEKYVDELIRLEGNPETSPRKTEVKSINGKKLIIVHSSTAQMGGESLSVYAFAMNETASIAFSYGVFNSGTENFNQILSTFKFTQ